MEKGSLGLHEIKLVINSGEDFNDGCRIEFIQHAIIDLVRSTSGTTVGN